MLLFTSVAASFLIETAEPATDLSEVLLALDLIVDLLELLGAETTSLSA